MTHPCRVLHHPFAERQQRVAGQTAEIACDQIRTVSRNRLGERLGPIDDAAAAAVRHVITEMYGVLSVRA
ncbi:MAG: type II toxin-antitoxin system PemK/MazF family toxin [Spirochaetaceae bacterium]